MEENTKGKKSRQNLTQISDTSEISTKNPTSYMDLIMLGSNFAKLIKKIGLFM